MDRLRDKIAHFIATPGVKKRIEEGVTDDNFYDFGAYVDLIAKSLRRFADDRHSYTPMGWKLNPEINSREELEKIADSHTALFHKWADILSMTDSELMDEPYYQPYWDYLEGSTSRAVRWDESGKPTTYVRDYPERTAKMEKVQKDLQHHEHAIHMLQVDILMELAEHHRYLWD